MANIYTNDPLCIFFLNQNNLVQDLNATGVINPIPTLSLLNDVNEELNNKIETTSADIIDSLSVETKAEANKFIRKISQTDGKIDVEFDNVTSADLNGKLERKQIDGLPKALNNISLSCSTLDAALSGVNDDLSANYVKRCADNNLTGNNTIVGTTHLSGTTIIDANNAGQALVFKQHYYNTDGSTKLCTEFNINEYGVDLIVTNDRAIKLSTEQSINQVLVNGTSLCSYIHNEGETRQQNAKTYTDNAIANLDVAKCELTGSTVLKSISENDGKIAVETRELSIGDLADGVSYIDGRLDTLSTGIRQDVNKDIDEKGKVLSTYINERVATAYKPQGSVNEYSELNTISANWVTGVPEEEREAVLSTHIGEVFNVKGKGKDTELSGQNYVWVHQGDISKPETKIWGWDELGGFINFSNYDTKSEIDDKIAASENKLSTDYIKLDKQVYDKLSAQISGNYTLLSSADKTNSDNINKVSVDLNSTSAVVVGHSNYIYALSVDKGIIAQLSNDISALTVGNVKALKFTHHINYIDGAKTKFEYVDLSNMFFELQLYDSDSSKITNGSIIDVVLSNDTDKITLRNDPLFAIGNGDVLIVHDHENAPFVRLDTLSAHGTHNVKNVYVLKAGVSRYEFEDLKEESRKTDAYVSAWLSSNFGNTGDRHDETTTIFNYEVSATSSLTVDGDVTLCSNLNVVSTLTTDNLTANDISVVEGLSVESDKLYITDNEKYSTLSNFIESVDLSVSEMSSNIAVSVDNLCTNISSMRSNFREKLSAVYADISSVSLTSDYETCISATFKLVGLLSELTSILG